MNLKEKAKRAERETETGLEIETVPVESLEPDPRNARRHPKQNLNAIKKSLERFGQVLPIVASPNGIVIGGNGTLQAARELNWKTIEVVRYDGQNARALAIALNQTALSAEWDKEILTETLLELDELDIEPSEIGFTEMDLDELAPLSSLRASPPRRVEEQHLPEKLVYQIVISMDDENAQRILFDRLVAEGYDCKVQIL